MIAILIECWQTIPLFSIRLIPHPDSHSNYLQNEGNYGRDALKDERLSRMLKTPIYLQLRVGYHFVTCSRFSLCTREYRASDSDPRSVPKCPENIKLCSSSLKICQNIKKALKLFIIFYCSSKQNQNNVNYYCILDYVNVIFKYVIFISFASSYDLPLVSSLWNIFTGKH